MTNKELYFTIKSALQNAGIEDSKFETDCIFEDILRVSSLELALQRDFTVEQSLEKQALEICRKRVSGYPLQYLLGEWEFYGLPFKVGRGVLIPRPDTETLVDAVLNHFKQVGNFAPKTIDLCSGSGCIAVSLKKQLPSSVVFAVELSADAFPYLVENIRLNNVDIKLIRGDITDGRLLDNFRDSDNIGDYVQLDCIVSNPPYLTDSEMCDLQKEVTFEPETALRGGYDGLKFYRIISCLWKEILKDGGLIAFEIGYEQGKAVTDILSSSGYGEIKIIKDFYGNDRVVTAIKLKLNQFQH